MLSARELKQRLREIAQACFPLITFWGFESEDVFRWKDRRYIFCDHAYFDRGYDKMNFRVIYSAPHQLKVRHDLPDDRMRRFCPFPRDWKQGSKVVVIPPPPMLARFYGAESWTAETVEALRKHTDREIVVKEKASGPLEGVLHEAWAVVSHSSVAAVEAAYRGVPVFGPETSPAYGVGLSDLSMIEAPDFPDREDWLRTLSYSQFSLDEITNGTARALLEEFWISVD